MVTFVSFICGTFVSFIAEKVWTLWFNLRRAFQTWLAQIKTATSKGKQQGQHQLKTFFVDYSSRRNWFNRPFPCCLMCVWHILPFQSSVYRGKQWTLQLALGLKVAVLCDKKVILIYFDFKTLWFCTTPKKLTSIWYY